MRAAAIALVIVLAGALAALWWYSRPAAAEVDVYFVRSTLAGDTVVPVSRTVSIPRLPGMGSPQGAAVRAALQALLDGPTTVERARGLGTEIPEGTRLLGLRIAGGIVYADFSADVESGGGSASMLGRLWQIVYTATQDSLAPRVRILIAGQERPAMGGEGVIIDHPLSRPAQPPNF
ncbi:MAG TPA: GerMN domain-containing protein [bacterium]|nr:GerMN domain-containing protein [bacterium]